MRILKNAYHDGVQNYLHNQWCKKLRSRLKNTTPTIISNNCCAGFIYHDLGIRFNSPTINLTIKNFPLFIAHFSHYMSCPLVKTNFGDKYPFPTGRLVSDVYPDIDILFNHYESFGDAERKWNERSKRIDTNNLFFIMDTYDNFFPQELTEYKKLPFSKNKAVLTHTPHPEMIDAHYINDGSQKMKKFRVVHSSKGCFRVSVA